MIHSNSAQKRVLQIQEQIRGLNLAPQLSPKTLAKKIHERVNSTTQAEALLGRSDSNSIQKIKSYYQKQIEPQVADLGVLEAVRNWLDNGSGYCSTSEAYRKVLENVSLLAAQI